MLGNRVVHEAVVVGASAGGLVAVTAILEALPADYALPIILVQHRSREGRDLLEEVLQPKCRLRVKQADEKERIAGGIVYIAPADYHLLIERDRSFSLSCDARVNFSRPSIDVLFEVAADVYGKGLLAIILTGASSDGARGIQHVRRMGGTTIAQNPATAPYGFMPQAAVATGSVQHILEITGIIAFLIQAGTLSR